MVSSLLSHGETADEAKWLDRLRQFQPIRFCPIVPDEAAPYPSYAVKG